MRSERGRACLMRGGVISEASVTLRCIVVSSLRLVSDS